MAVFNNASISIGFGSHQRCGSVILADDIKHLHIELFRVLSYNSGRAEEHHYQHYYFHVFDFAEAYNCGRYRHTHLVVPNS
jgi:hypothetical protein